MSPTTTPLKKLVLEELALIGSEKRGTTAGGGIPGLSALADAALLCPEGLYRALSPRSRPTLQTCLRLIAALSPAPERAEMMLHAAGYDISMDWSPACRDYRELINLGPRELDRKNEILGMHGDAIFRCLRT